jgi:hypothetical protein
MIVNGYKIEPVADLRGAHLVRTNLQRADLRGADLRGANLGRADLEGANLTGANLTGAVLRDADLTRADLTGADLTGADLTGADLTRANLTGADLTGADLTGADLTRANLRNADLTDANLRGVYLRGADLQGANLRNADLRGADRAGANLIGANLQGADLTSAIIRKAPPSELSVFLEKINFPFGAEAHSELSEELLTPRLQEIESLAIRLSGLTKQATPGDTVAKVLDRKPELTGPIMDAVVELLSPPDDPDREANPKTATRTDEPLWKYIVQEVKKSSKGGKPGQWSARKAQLCVKLYKEAGGGYVGKKTSDNALTKWTKEDWRTKSGKASLKTGERYLPAKAIESLTEEEYAETTRAKRRGLKRGQQFVPQPSKIAKKTAKFRRPR